ncbi:hypothetical protein DTL42_07185, partial [Bremerella cremea]
MRLPWMVNQGQPVILHIKAWLTTSEYVSVSYFPKRNALCAAHLTLRVIACVLLLSTSAIAQKVGNAAE